MKDSKMFHTRYETALAQLDQFGKDTKLYVKLNSTFNLALKQHSSVSSGILLFFSIFCSSFIIKFAELQLIPSFYFFLGINFFSMRFRRLFFLIFFKKILVRNWSSTLKAQLKKSKNFPEELGIELLKTSDWRIRVAFLQMQEQSWKKEKEIFPLIKESAPEPSFPKQLFRFWFYRSDTFCALFFSIAVLYQAELKIASMLLLAFVCLILALNICMLIYGSIKRNIAQASAREVMTELSEGIKNYSAYGQCFHMAQLQQVERLIYAIKAKNEKATKSCLFILFYDLLINLENYKKEAVIDEILLPVFEDHFGSPLPVFISKAIISYKEKKL